MPQVWRSNVGHTSFCYAVKPQSFDGGVLMKYIPRLNDYVSWHVEGWVYLLMKNISIEIAVKPKADDLVPLHKNHH